MTLNVLVIQDSPHGRIEYSWIIATLTEARLLTQVGLEEPRPWPVRPHSVWWPLKYDLARAETFVRDDADREVCLKVGDAQTENLCSDLFEISVVRTSWLHTLLQMLAVGGAMLDFAGDLPSLSSSDGGAELRLAACARLGTNRSIDEVAGRLVRWLAQAVATRDDPNVPADTRKVRAHELQTLVTSRRSAIARCVITFCSAVYADPADESDALVVVDRAIRSLGTDPLPYQ